MLTLTTPAAEYLSQARQRSTVGEDATLRVAGPPDSSSGYSIGFVAEPLAGDAVGESHGISMCVDPEVSAALDDSAIDLVRDGDQARLVLVPAT
jgi:Fe-S cluster assembly iron-binding protein IscA